MLSNSIHSQIVEISLNFFRISVISIQSKNTSRFRRNWLNSNRSNFHRVALIGASEATYCNICKNQEVYIPFHIQEIFWRKAITNIFRSIQLLQIPFFSKEQKFRDTIY